MMPMPPLDAAQIGHCITVLEQTAAPGRRRDLHALCPGLGSRLAAAPPLRGLGWGRSYNLSMLRDIRGLFYPAPRAQPLVFQYQALPGILKAAYRPPVHPQVQAPSAWDRFLHRVEERLFRALSAHPQARQWLAVALAWMQAHAGLAGGLLTVLLWAAAGVAVLLLMRGRRFRAWWRGWLAAASGRRSAPVGHGASRETLPEEAVSAPALLCAALRSLRRQGLLAEDESLTNRECLRLLERLDPGQAGLFGRLVEGAEAVSYGGAMLAPAQLQQLRTIARSLSGAPATAAVPAGPVLC